MNTHAELTRFIRPIAGKTLTLLIVLRIMGGRATPGVLCAITGWSLPTVRKHMETAIAFNYVKLTDSYHNPVYFLSDGITQLDFFDFQSERVLQIEATTALLINNLNNNKDIKSSSTEQSERILQINQEVFGLLKELGTGEPTLSRYAADEFITPDYLKAHIAKWRKENLPLRILLHRLKMHDPAPNGQKPYDPNKYTSGKYSDVINS